MGPLAGLTIIEMAGLGPGPFAAMMLAYHGAEVIRVDRPGAPHDPFNPLLRSRKSVILDLKDPADCERLRALVRRADGLIEGFRPGVMERLGLGPDTLLIDNKKLVYGRMTGWGQTGPFASKAGHDINYIALSGTLAALGRAGDKPTPPINLVGDFGGGGMLLAFGMVAALLAVRNGAAGQVIDCAMVDGAALLMSLMWGFRAAGKWEDERGVNMLDTGAPFYDTYETSDGRYVAVGAIEPRFYAELCEGLEMATQPERHDPMDRATWREQKQQMAQIIGQRTQGDWIERFAAYPNACFTPVLGFAEAASHPHNVDRKTFASVAGVVQPAPAPRYSGTPCAVPLPPVVPGSNQDLV